MNTGRIIEFVENHLTPIIIVVAATLLALIVLLIALVLGSNHSAAEAARLQNERALRAVPIEQLFLPESPLILPEFRKTRERTDKWSVEEVARWYTVPDSSDMKQLREAAAAHLDRIWESIP